MTNILVLKWELLYNNRNNSENNLDTKLLYVSA